MILIYLGPLLCLWAIILGLAKRKEIKAKRIRAEAEASGLIEPASLHPKINEAVCIGCATCVTACPEGEILGLVRGKAVMVEPSHCIGHGACATSCPMGAIELVFGTEKRGIDIPNVGPDFQTNVPGIYIAGELGGMGLIRNAIEQGRQAMEAIVKAAPSRRGPPLDVMIVGSGPAGMSASLEALRTKLKFVTVEQDSLGGTVAHFPRGKLVMTAPANLPIHGTVNLRETSKEQLLEFWTDVVTKAGLTINYEEQVLKVDRVGKHFKVITTKAEYETAAILLSIGRRGTPRKLDVPGEEQEKVVYRLIDPEQYKGQHVLVVGGGDSALEAATSIAEQPDTVVTLSYRGDGFSRAKPKNRDKAAAMAENGQLTLALPSTVDRIDRETVTLKDGDTSREIRNDAIIVCAGGILPTPFLKSIGIEIETKYGTA